VVGETEALLVPPEDPAALAVALQVIRSDAPAAARRAAAAQQRLAREFSTGPWLARIDDVYIAASAQSENASR
jgi:hypothetical protein